MDALIPRFAQERLAERAAAFRVVIVNGPRQAGKTTLLRLFQDGHGGSFRSMDDPTTLRTATNDPTEFARYGATPRVIDEVQRGGDDLVLAIKHVVDRDNSRGQFILSGSTRFLTVPTLSESLAGRAVFVDLWPLTVAERTGAPGDFCDMLFAGRGSFAGADESRWDRQAYLDLMCTGGYPEVLGIRSAKLRHGWFEGYLSTVVLRDIGSFAQIQHSELIPRMLHVLAARAGGQAVLSHLAKDLQLNHATARNYLTYLDTVFLTGRVAPWSSNLTAKHVKTPKIYPTDSGLAAHLLQVGLETLIRPENPTTGALTETFVFAELTRLLAASDIGASLHYYRDRDGREIDFVLEKRNGQIVGIEVKASSTVGPDDFRHLRWLADRLGDRFAGGYVIHLGSGTHPFGDRMMALPLSAMWHHRS
ncbi:MAG: ATP-binding protein [Haloechinothrix sp.]